jgi:hypothetical protein
MGVRPAVVRGILRDFSPFRVPSTGSRFSGGFRLKDIEGIFQCFSGDGDSSGTSSSVFSAERGIPFNSAGEATSTGSSYSGPGGDMMIVGEDCVYCRGSAGADCVGLENDERVDISDTGESAFRGIGENVVLRGSGGGGGSVCRSLSIYGDVRIASSSGPNKFEGRRCSDTEGLNKAPPVNLSRFAASICDGMSCNNPNECVEAHGLTS